MSMKVVPKSTDVPIVKIEMESRYIGTRLYLQRNNDNRVILDMVSYSPGRARALTFVFESDSEIADLAAAIQRLVK